MATGPWAPSWKACEWDGGEEGRKDQDTSLAGGWAGPEGASPNTPPCHLQRGAAHGQARAPSVPGGMSPTAAMRPPWPSHPQQPSLLRPRFQSPARGTAHLRGSPGHGAQRSEAGAEGPPPHFHFLVQKWGHSQTTRGQKEHKGDGAKDRNSLDRNDKERRSVSRGEGRGVPSGPDFRQPVGRPRGASHPRGTEL